MQELLNQFYLAVEKEEREPLYRQIQSCAGADCAALREIWELRYPTGRGKLFPVKDGFLNAMMELLYIASQKPSWLNRKRLSKQMLAAASALGVDRYPEKNPGTQMLYRKEYENVVLFFIRLGQTDDSYSRGAFNLMQLSDKKMARKIWGDLNTMAHEMPAEFGMEERFAPFAQAAETIYDQLFKEKN